MKPPFSCRSVRCSSSRRARFHSRGALYWRALFFLTGFVLLLVLVCTQFLMPAMIAARDATHAERERLNAFSRLLLAIVLFILIVGMILAFSVKRFFLPRRLSPRTKTEYTDAWAEAGRRLKPPPEE